MKAFKRVEILSKIYQKKFDQLVSYYDPSDGSDIEKPEKRLKCTSVLGGDDFLQNLYGTARTCTIQGYDECMNLVEYAVKVKDLNQRLHSEGCIRIY
jgi:hypothetical protein